MIFKINRSLLWGLFLIINSLLWGWVAYEVMFVNRTIKSNIIPHLQNVAQANKVQIQSLIETSQQILKTLKFQYEREGPLNERLLDDYLQSGILNNSLFNQAGIIDKNGIYIYSNLKNQKKIDLSDREHFWIHKNSYPYELFVSKPIIGRASNKWSIQITEKLVDKKGEFNGAAVLSIDPRVIIGYFEKYKLGDSGLIALMDSKGYVRVLKVNDHDYIDDSIQKIELPRNWEEMVLKNEPFKLNIDQFSRYYAIEKVNNNDLLVLVGVAEEGSLTPLNFVWINLVYLSTLLSIVFLFVVLYIDKIIKDNDELSNEILKSQLISQDIKNFYTGVFNQFAKLLTFQLNKIQEDASFIESQSFEELSNISAKSIGDHAAQLAGAYQNMLALQSAFDHPRVLNLERISVHDVIARLSRYLSLHEVGHELLHQDGNDKNLQELLVLDVEESIDVLYQLITHAANINFSESVSLIKYFLVKEKSTQTFLRFELSLDFNELSDQLQKVMQTQTSLSEVDIDEEFEFNLARYRLQQLKGSLVIESSDSMARKLFINISG